MKVLSHKQNSYKITCPFCNCDLRILDTDITRISQTVRHEKVHGTDASTYDPILIVDKYSVNCGLCAENIQLDENLIDTAAIKTLESRRSAGADPVIATKLSI